MESQSQQGGHAAGTKLHPYHRLKEVHTCKQAMTEMNYFIDMEIGQTKCTKFQPNSDSCLFYD